MSIRNPIQFKFNSLNFIKFFIIIPGVSFHILEFLEFDLNQLESFTPIKILYSYGRTLMFTGFLATLCVFFPLSFSNKPIFNKKRSALIIFGLFLLSFIYHDPRIPFIKTEWNFYYYALTSLIFISLIKRFFVFQRFNLFSFFFSAVMLSIPFWKFSNHIPNDFFRFIFIGDCNNSLLSYGEWPILPWIFLPLFSINYANLLTSNHFFEEIKTIEWLIWTLLILVLGFNYWGSYFHSNLDNYSCTVFSKSPIIFWSHLLPFLFLIRLNRVRNLSFLFNNKFSEYIYRFNWIKDFGLTYLISLTIIAIISLFGEADNVLRYYQPYYYLFLVLFVLCSSEIIARKIKTKTTF